MNLQPELPQQKLADPAERTPLRDLQLQCVVGNLDDHSTNNNFTLIGQVESGSCPVGNGWSVNGLLTGWGFLSLAWTVI